MVEVGACRGGDVSRSHSIDMSPKISAASFTNFLEDIFRFSKLKEPSSVCSDV